MVNTASKKRRHGSTNNDTDDDEIEQEYQVEAILDKRVRGNKTQYFLKWKGYPNSENTVRFSIDEMRKVLNYFHLKIQIYLLE